MPLVSGATQKDLGDHLDLARCVAVIGEDDLREATTAMGLCLFHLQRDLLVASWEPQTFNVTATTVRSCPQRGTVKPSPTSTST